MGGVVNLGWNGGRSEGVQQNVNTAKLIQVHVIQQLRFDGWRVGGLGLEVSAHKNKSSSEHKQILVQEH